MQTIYLLIIIITGIGIGLAAIALKENIGIKLIKWGGIVALSGIGFSTFFGKQLTDVLLLIDVAGFGRAYPGGCIILLAGIIVQVWRIIFPLDKSCSSGNL